MDNEILIVLIAILVLQAVIMLVVIRKLRKDKENGYPFQDEMSKQLLYKSGAFSFLLSCPLWIVIFIYSSLSGEIQPNWDIFFGLMGMMVIFITTIFIIKKKGLV